MSPDKINILIEEFTNNILILACGHTGEKLGRNLAGNELCNLAASDFPVPFPLVISKCWSFSPRYFDFKPGSLFQLSFILLDFGRPLTSTGDVVHDPHPSILIPIRKRNQMSFVYLVFFFLILNYIKNNLIYLILKYIKLLSFNY